MGDIVLGTPGVTVLTENGGNVTWGSGAPAGCLLQVLQAKKTGVQSITAGSGGVGDYDHVTNLDVTITPKLSGSKMLITLMIHVGCAGGNEGAHIRLYKNDAVITEALGVTSDARDPAFMHCGAHDSNYEIYPATGMYLDDNTTGTAPIKYSVYLRGHSDSHVVRINESEGQTNNHHQSRTISTLTIQEIAG
tara:strand:+ start:1572 stop:2147 length:576 start_codon:yes stop_codon:yes gene_type:complete